MLFHWQLLSIPTYTKSLKPFTSHDLTRKSHRASLDLHTFLAKHCVTSSISEYIPRELAQVCLHSLFDVSNSRFYSLFWCLESPILAPTITASRDLVHFSLCFHGASRHKGMASASKFGESPCSGSYGGEHCDFPAFHVWLPSWPRFWLRLENRSFGWLYLLGLMSVVSPKILRQRWCP